MKKTLLTLFLAAVLVFTCVMPSALAESAGSRVKDFLNKVQNIVTEEVGSGEEIAKKVADKVITFVKEIPEEDKESLKQLVLKGIGKLTEGTDKIDADTVTNLIGMLFGSGFGTKESKESGENYSDTEEYQSYLAWNDAIDSFLIEHYSEGQESADVLIPHSYLIGNDEGTIPDTFVLGGFGIEAFTADGTDLKMKYAAKDVLLLTLEQDEATGVYKVVDCIQAEDGEKYADSVADMCAKYGVALDNFNASIAYRDWCDLMDLTMYLEEHPEVQRIEVQGELKTKEEIEDFASGILSALISAED